MDFNLTTMSRHTNPHFEIEKLVVNPFVTLADITSGCVIVGLEEFLKNFLLNELLKINITRLVESDLPHAMPIFHAVDKIDVTNHDDVKLAKNSGSNKKKGGKKGEKESAKKTEREKEKEVEGKKEEEDRLKKWNDDWDRKLKAQEELDEIPCCSDLAGLTLKPKTQSNVWIKVTQDKTIQDVQMAFMHVPVPKPKAPPLPKLVKLEPVDPVSSPDKKTKNGEKKKVKGKKK